MGVFWFRQNRSSNQGASRGAARPRKKAENNKRR